MGEDIKNGNKVLRKKRMKTSKRTFREGACGSFSAVTYNFKIGLA